MMLRFYSLLNLFILAFICSNSFADTPLTTAQKAASSAPKLVIATVPVGDINNPPDIVINPITGILLHFPYGAVTNAFHMGTYDTTATEYTRFLNAVASSSDPNQLYDPRMSSDTNVASINRAGTPGNYTYSLKSWQSARLPIVYVSWFCSARYVNWLHNGQPVGGQDSTTTEAGVYNLAAPIVIKNVQRYCDFLNAAAKTDVYGLYENSIVSFISQQGNSGSYSYTLTPTGSQTGATLNVTWNSAARFANWKYNATHGSSDTEQGLYVISNGMKDLAGDADITPTDYCKMADGARFYLPSEDQYYKTAFFKRNVDTNNQLTAEYWEYPTKSDTAPGNNRNAPNAVNYYVASNEDYSTTGWFDKSNYRFGNFGQPPFITPVGAYSLAPSPYGAFDMGGNVSQWLTPPAGQASVVRPIRGGGWGNMNQWPNGADQLSKDKGSATIDSSAKRDYIGFRIATP